MSALVALAKAMAVERGRAQRICEVRHVHLGSSPLIFIPLAMAGETAAPLAAMIGEAQQAPRLLAVAEPRDRARLLGRSTRLRRTTGEWAVPSSVPVLGRWLTFFADHAEHPGSSLMLAMTDVLAQHWATGQSALEDGNLATLLAWIEPPGSSGSLGGSGQQAARTAEQTAPPAGPATDPVFDNEVLEHRMQAIRTARLTGDGRACDRAFAALKGDLVTQLAPTWQLMWRALALLRQLPEGAHVRRRWEADVKAASEYATYLSEGGLPQPRRDGAIAAARRLARLERLQDMVAAQRAFDDPLVMAEYRMTGEAFGGQVVAASPGRLDTAGPRRKLRPHITVATSDSLQLEVGTAGLTWPARPGQEARIIGIDTTHVTLELSGGMGRKLIPDPGSVPEIGERLCYTTLNDSYQPPPSFPDPEDTPWTHGGPPPQYVPTDDDAREEWS
jgi:hypothetical protein